MSKFDRYMLSQLMTLFGFFALILVAVYWVNRAVRLFSQLIADGQSAWVFFEFTALSLPYNIRLALPLAAFAAAVYVTNKLSNDSELAVMKATGFSPWRLARPVLYFGLILGLGMAVLNHLVEPASRKQLADRRDEIAANASQRFLTEGQFVNPTAGVTMFLAEVAETGDIRDILISDGRNPAREVTYTADRAALVRSETGPRLVMFDGLIETFETADRTLTVTRFKDFSYDIGALIQPPSTRSLQPAELSTATLLRATAETQAATGASAAFLIFEGHDRIARMLQPLATALIGFAALLVGGYSRFGMARQIGFGVVLLIGLQSFMGYTASLARKDETLWALSYLPALVAFAVAAALLWYAGRSRRVAPGFDVGALT